jgi:sugar phosphate isomerase/epimerase
MSNNKRRDILKLSALAAAGFLLPSATIKAANWLDGFDETNAKIRKFGLQLYSLRDDLPKNPKAVLKQVANFGYQQIEGYEGAQGMFWGMSNKEFKSFTNDLGIKMVSSHCDINTNFESKAEKAAEIGMKYLICPYLGPQKSIDAFKKAADTFNKCGEITNKYNIKFAYHNHDYSFKKIDGEIPQDVMLNNTDADKVYFELDIYWAVTAGVNPADYFTKYKNRFTLCHIKDRMKNANPNDANSSCILGEGVIDYGSILKVAKANGMKYFIVEQERYDGSTPLASIEKNAAYMQQLRF